MALPAWFAPELATLVSAPPTGSEWLHELKLDGYRLLCRIEAGEARLLTRRGNDWTEEFPGIARACRALPVKSAILDGEAVILDPKGRSNFQALQNGLGRERPDLFFFAFDLLHLDDQDLRRTSLLERKEKLRALLMHSPPEVIRYNDHVVGRGEAFLREACRLRAEGIVCKRTAGHYRSGRTRDWLKVKCLSRQEFVIVGFSDPSGSRRGIGSLLVGAHDASGELTFCGKVGTGYDHKTLLELRRMLEPIERPTAPVRNPLRGADARGVHWVEPKYVAEVAFTEWTADGIVRHPSFQGLRKDKPPEDVVVELQCE